MITTHTRKVPYGHTGYITIKDGASKPYNIWSHIVSLTREDAKRDAMILKQDLESTSKD